jgi:hypothetical protein
VLDAAGNLVEGRDGKGALILHAYDALNRPIRLWARDGAGQALTLRERIVYGDAADSGLTRAAAANLLGSPIRHYDEIGLLTFEAYDFKGNVLKRWAGHRRCGHPGGVQPTAAGTVCRPSAWTGKRRARQR